MERKLWFLKQCNLFENLTPEQADHLEGRSLMRTFKKRSLIYAPTEPGQSVMVVGAGRVKIKDITPEGKETILAFIDEGEVFGELALVSEDAREEYAEAVADSQILVLPREVLLGLMETRPDLSLSITKLVGMRRRRIENRFRNVLFLSSKDRLIRLLAELVESHGQRNGNQCEIRLPLTHQELAGLIGVTRETVTVVLGQLQYESVIKINRRRIIVVNCKRLEEMASGTVLLKGSTVTND